MRRRIRIRPNPSSLTDRPTDKEQSEAAVMLRTNTIRRLGGWVMLEIPNASNDCKILLPEPPKVVGNLNHALGHIAGFG